MSDDEDILKQLDERVSSIQQHQHWRDQQKLDRESQLDTEWQKFLVSAGKLRTRLQGHPKLRYFSIARDQSQVAVSFRLGVSASRMVTFYRSNPEGKIEVPPRFWCREEGRLDEKLTTAKELNERLLRHCASALAAS